MTREWYTEVMIRGKKYRVNYQEWSGYGGSVHRSSQMVLIENESQKENQKINSEIKESPLGKKEE